MQGLGRFLQLGLRQRGGVYQRTQCASGQSRLGVGGGGLVITAQDAGIDNDPDLALLLLRQGMGPGQRSAEIALWLLQGVSVSGFGQVSQVGSGLRDGQIMMLDKHFEADRGHAAQGVEPMIVGARINRDLSVFQMGQHGRGRRVLGQAFCRAGQLLCQVLPIACVCLRTRLG
ncbi:hypothetical protein C9382_27015 [Pseudomonas aylmerensis]|uniref:Uncharacterized protein n=1 Tax=Pseudomonas aylmerensis TaxID=1869229 RepID=A0A2T4FMP7_9PSED|nr:hypothetical protein BBG20_16975 [Pseudomonas aylmerensis]PTC24692.1 hypothetical protein C9382_27015 [Pseudomonas aylmerensis]